VLANPEIAELPNWVIALVASGGLAAASFFPAIFMGIFSKKMNKEGAIAGMLVGIILMLFYMLKFKFAWFGGGSKEDWWFGISPEGFGTVAMLANFSISIIVSKFTPIPPLEVQEIVENIRIPGEVEQIESH
ncbi:MAG: sodium:solute symporter family transporter, partial [Polaribacter sp.]